MEAGDSRGPCLWAVVETAPDHVDAVTWCDSIDAGKDRDECHFLRAEGARDWEGCSRAGRFADDCRLHLFSGRLAGLRAAPTDLPSVQAEVIPLLEAVGVADDERYWSAALRWSLSHQHPLDRGSCDALQHPGWREACQQTALAVYGDRLNRTRDFGGGVPCSDEALPRALQHTPDPGLDAMRAQWRQRDGCAPR